MAIDDFEDAANAALEEVSEPGSATDSCAEIVASWRHRGPFGPVPANDNSESSEDSTLTESGDSLVIAVSILPGPWSPPGLEDGHDLFFVYRADPQGRWAPSAVCIRAGPTILTMKPERTQ